MTKPRQPGSIKPTLHADRTTVDPDEWAGMCRLLGVPNDTRSIWKPEVWNRMMIQLGMEPVAKKGEVVKTEWWNEMVRRMWHS